MRAFLYFVLGCLTVATPAPARAQEKAPPYAGGPALTRAWGGDDYSLFADLVAAGTVPLPVYSNAQGKELLQRMTSLENLAGSRDERLSLDARMDHFGKLLGGVSKMLDQYQAEANKGADVHAEAAQFTAFALRTVGVGVRLIDELMPKVKKDERYNVRMDGIKKYQAGLISMFINTGTSLMQKDFFTAQDLTVMLDAMAETLPGVIRAIPAEYRLELRKKLEVDKGTYTDEHDIQSIQKMLDELGK